MQILKSHKLNTQNLKKILVFFAKFEVHMNGSMRTIWMKILISTLVEKTQNWFEVLAFHFI